MENATKYFIRHLFSIAFWMFLSNFKEPVKIDEMLDSVNSNIKIQ